LGHHFGRDLIPHVALEANCHGQHVAGVCGMTNFAACGALGIDKWSASAGWVWEGTSGRLLLESCLPEWGAGGWCVMGVSLVSDATCIVGVTGSVVGFGASASWAIASNTICLT
jgi:hypothetical protein